MSQIELGYTADYHVHLRQGDMMNAVTPTIREGGISVAYVMPNLTPPITNLEAVLKYKEELQKLAPKTTFLMTFYLSRLLTPELVERAAESGAIRGIKCYPAGVTTNSSAGVDPNNFTEFYPIFEVMQKHGLVLNIHGEKPSVDNNNDEESITVLNAEPKFLPALFKIHNDFPKLKLVLEHCSTRKAIDAIYEINANLKEGETPIVCGSITAHHLFLTVDDWAGNPVNFCKPVAKLPEDRKALIEAATSGKPYFFFGSDSAPHDIAKKSTHIKVSAGVYTQPYVLTYVAEVFDKVGKLANLRGFVSTFGNSFYGIDESKLVCKDKCFLVKKPVQIPEVSVYGNIRVVAFQPGGKFSWRPEWH
ncbi:DEKNAAC100026 [Brettanomyces naardenensis]|uniref:dihydroorotase n=1 Tax=Brettanomyces naardenensis TaxID=13370 RepID=A0A448YGL5_BRENA|nr:DEKNAAC100026 [Brettanomyces naardenensis]